MPTNLSVLFTISCKSLKLTGLLLLSPLFFFGQTLTGLWTGALSNDSITVRKDQSFEIALTEYKGKVYGYSRSEFIVDDTLYYVVKRVKGTIEGDVCEVVDDEIMSYNFRGKLDKGIKVTSIFRRNQSDSSWYLDGSWKTNATKKYYAVTGKVKLEEEKDLAASKIFPHLEELKLADDVAFYKERKEGVQIVRMVKPEKVKTEYSTKPVLNNTDVTVITAKPDLQRAETKPPPVAVITQPVVAITETNKLDVIPSLVETSAVIQAVEIPEEFVGVKKTVVDLPKTDTKNIPATTVVVSPTATTKTIAQNKIPDVVKARLTDAMVEGGKEEKKIMTEPVGKTDIKKETIAIVTSKNKPTTVPPAVTDNKPVKTEPVAKTIAKQEPPIIKQPDNNSVKPQTDTKSIAKTNNPVTTTSAKPITETKKQDIVITKPVAVNNPVPEKKEVKTEPLVAISVIPQEKKPVVDIIAKAATVAGRKSEFSQIVSFKSDSLELSLYDNGEIDGDTVSIYLNGEVIMSKQGLKASAIKKTIYITPGNEDFTLVLFAENLGKYPPNTGLLVVHDGDDVYNLRFSSDFEKNAGIIFRRKK